MCMTWKVEALRKKLNKDKVLKNIFDSMIGRDVTKKLFEVSFKLPSSKGERLPRSGSCVYLRSSESIERGK